MRTRAGLLLATAVLLAGAPARAHDAALHGQQSEDQRWEGSSTGAPVNDPETEAGAADYVALQIADAELVDQSGRRLHFANDVLGDRIVVMALLYTSCTTVCPVTASILGLVQEGLGARLGREVSLVSLTVDPATDTPERMKAYAEKVGAGPSWVWLTGDKPVVDQVLRDLGAYTADPAKHPGVILVGDAGHNRWTRFYGFPSPERILAAVEDLLAARSGVSGW